MFPTAPATYGVSVRAVDDDGEYRADRPAALDPTFGAGGIVSAALGQDLFERSRLAVQPDGKILAATAITVSSSSGGRNLLVSRYEPDGALDPTFGNGGRSHVPHAVRRRRRHLHGACSPTAEL